MVEMTSKERMMTALRCGVPDRVPVAPDFSCMIPCRLQNRPFWEVLLYGRPPLWKAYLDACKHFGTDAWFIYGGYNLIFKDKFEVVREISDVIDNRIYERRIYKTSAGDLTETNTYLPADAPTPTEKLIKDFKKDFPKILKVFSEIESYSTEPMDTVRAALGDGGLLGVGIGTPGMQIFSCYFEGNLEAAVYAYYDEPELFEELSRAYERQQNQIVEICCKEKAESILTGGSGSITMQSPQLWEHLALPAIIKQTRMCREAGVISGIHSCGKEMHIVKTCAEKTDLNYINPLEIPPMGDCTLKEARSYAKDKLALMGNLHTTNVMLRGNTDDVRLASLQAILDAGENGGFVLSTGDQCGRDTPDENIFEMVRVAKEFGTYPLNIDKIQTEIERLKKIKRLQF